MDRKIRRGEIYIADLDPVIGSEQGGERPVLVIQNNVGNTHSPMTVANSILECASEKFDCCSIEVNDELTQLILEMFAEATGFNEELIAQTVEQIIIDENGKIKLRVKSGVEIKGDI